jgi:uncharacterized protein
MNIDFREIPGQGLAVSADILVDLPAGGGRGDLRGLYRFPVTLKVDAHLEKVDDNVFVRAGFSGALQAHCVRCLGPFETKLESDFRLTLMPRSSEAAALENEREKEADDVDVVYYEEECFRLGDAVTEQVLLTLNLYPHCDEACKGLCSMCGRNLNTGTCGCAEAAVDSRWAALQQFKSRAKL